MNRLGWGEQGWGATAVPALYWTGFLVQSLVTKVKIKVKEKSTFNIYWGETESHAYNKAGLEGVLQFLHCGIGPDHVLCVCFFINETSCCNFKLCMCENACINCCMRNFFPATCPNSNTYMYTL